MPLMNGTCVAIGDRGVLIRGPSGSGKSDLALRLIDQGAKLVSDDYCEASVMGGELFLSAPKTIAGNLEVRGYGIVNLNAISSVKVDLVVDLVPAENIERMPETMPIDVEGARVRRIELCAFEASAPAKIRMALTHEPEQA